MERLYSKWWKRESLRASESDFVLYQIFSIITLPA